MLLLGVDPSKQLDHPLPTAHPHVTYAYMKYMWKSTHKVGQPPTSHQQKALVLSSCLSPSSLSLHLHFPLSVSLSFSLSLSPPLLTLPLPCCLTISLSVKVCHLFELISEVLCLLGDCVSVRVRVHMCLPWWDCLTCRRAEVTGNRVTDRQAGRQTDTPSQARGPSASLILPRPPSSPSISSCGERPACSLSLPPSLSLRSLALGTPQEP